MGRAWVQYLGCRWSLGGVSTNEERGWGSGLQDGAGWGPRPGLPEDWGVGRKGSEESDLAG